MCVQSRKYVHYSYQSMTLRIYLLWIYGKMPMILRYFPTKHIKISPNEVKKKHLIEEGKVKTFFIESLFIALLMENIFTN